MRRGDINHHGNDLASRVALNSAAGSIGELEATALPEVALGRVKVALRGTDLGHGLDVAVGVRGHLVPDLGTAGGLHGGAERTGSRGGDSAVGRNAGGEESGGGDLLVHLEGGLVSSIPVEEKKKGEFFWINW